MPAMLQAFFMSILRKGLTALGVWFVARGYFTEGEMTEYVVALSIVVLSTAWSMWVKYKDRIKFLTALEAPKGTTESQVKTMVGTGTGASLSSGSGS